MRACQAYAGSQGRWGSCEQPAADAALQAGLQLAQRLDTLYTHVKIQHSVWGASSSGGCMYSQTLMCKQALSTHSSLQPMLHSRQACSSRSALTPCIRQVVSGLQRQ